MLTVGLESWPDQSRDGASNAMSTPSKPWRSSSSRNRSRNVSSRSASIVLSGTSTVSTLATLTAAWRRGVKNARRCPPSSTTRYVTPTSRTRRRIPIGSRRWRSCTGWSRPDPFHARVLEIGCGAGGNLMAMAAATPGIQAVGVDLAAVAIEDGRAIVAAVGLDERRAAPGGRPRTDRRPARRIRLHRRPRRLRLDSGRRARRAAGHDQAPRWRPTGSPTSPTTRSRAATSAACCATSASGTRVTSRARPRKAEKAQELYIFLKEQRVTVR